MERTLSPGERIPSTHVCVPILGIVHRCPFLFFAARYQLDRHDAFSELMATSIVPELIHLYIPLGSVSP